MITGLWLVDLTRLLGAAEDNGGGSSSSQPAVIALIVGISSSLAAMYSIIRQYRGDSAQAKAAKETVAHEANKQSFEQLMATSKYNADRIAALQIEFEKLENENDALRRLLRQNGIEPP